MSFAKNIGQNIGKNISKSLTSKYCQKRLDHAKQYTADAFKTSSKWFIQKPVEVTGNLIGNKIADKIKGSAKKSPQNNLETSDEIQVKKYISPELRQKIIDDLRLMED